ncbi:NADPH-dependent FMN reductase [Novosphingobium sp. JCM 18896]|uniref:NADPH-dependent FMN reductase n=1 Tax=Novosphingobium sp. JCM 18896 TaxID=2989731 RepID=UPI002223498F|nr:NAD(P)H-dependent oxidoreductase [Novosphingobium sp. JCM 18896]MCW1427557.1 NAD(P)H-dependent oxidoreductase [Novosphingobium sp. JCM 18896]
MTANTGASPLKVLTFAGSLRRESYNRSLIRAAVELAPADMEVELFDLAAVPLYDGDVEEAGDPEGVVRFKQAIAAADGVIMATPEYNHGVPGVMKNAIDWASRPPRDAVLAHKPVAIFGASPGITGTARGQSQLRQAFEFTESYCMPQPEVLVFRAHEKFDAEGRLTDERTRQGVARFMAAFADWVRRCQR